MTEAEKPETKEEVSEAEEVIPHDPEAGAEQTESASGVVGGPYLDELEQEEADERRDKKESEEVEKKDDKEAPEKEAPAAPKDEKKDSGGKSGK